MRPSQARKRAGPSLVNVIDALSVARPYWSKALIGLLAVAASTASIASVPGIAGFCGAGLALIMLAIAVIDWRSFIIPDWLNALALGLAFIHAAVGDPSMMGTAVAAAVVRAVVLALIFFVVRGVYAYVRNRQGLGLGDVKLAGVAGAWLDFATIPIAIELAVLAALSGYVVRQMILRRPISGHQSLALWIVFRACHLGLLAFRIRMAGARRMIVDISFGDQKVGQQLSALICSCSVRVV